MSKKKPESFGSRHLPHRVEKDRKYFSAFLSNSKLHTLFRVVNIVGKKLKDMF